VGGIFPLKNRMSSSFRVSKMTADINAFYVDVRQFATA
jgi:hypothetical protein